MRFLTRHHRNCERCRHWQVDDEQADPVLGECRLEAPRSNPVPPDPADPDAQVGLPRRPWPTTESRDWCGAWQGHRRAGATR